MSTPIRRLGSRGLRLAGVPEHFNLPWRLALESGELDDLGVSWADEPGGTGAMIDALAAGEVDVVSILTEGTVAAIARGLRATIVQVYVDSPLQWGVHVAADSTITSVDQLHDARVAISRPLSGSHLMAFVQAERRGWTMSDERFVAVGGLDGARAAFANGDVDVFLWDRYMTQPLVDAGEFRRIGVEPTPWPSFVIAARDDVLTGRTTEVGRVVDAVVAAARSFAARPDAADIVADRYGLSPDTASSWLSTTAFPPRSAPDPTIVSATEAVLRRAGAL